MSEGEELTASEVRSRMKVWAANMHEALWKEAWLDFWRDIEEGEED